MPAIRRPNSAYQSGRRKGAECLDHFEGRIDRATYARIGRQEARYLSAYAHTIAAYLRGWMESAPHEEHCACEVCAAMREAEGAVR